MMKKMPLVSVVIPTWNRSATIRSCIDSVLSQTYNHFEILVCDDGSTDNTMELVRSYHDTRVVWVPGERTGGPSAPRNRGVSIARGEWVAFLDSDDIWLEDKLESQMRALTFSGRPSCCTNALIVNSIGESGGEMLNISKDIISYDDLIRENLIVCSSVLLNKKLFIKANGFPCIKTGEDYALWLRVAVFADFVYIKKPFIKYHDEPTLSLRSKMPNQASLKRSILASWISWYNTKAYASKRGEEMLTKIIQLRRDLLWRVPLMAAYHIYKKFLTK